ncbi:hypothetical protein C6C15_14460 [Microbacterium sp. str. 'China']|nr:hypothetical protein C6C15_14460 [Microbacterium sp. str. 'China']
MRRLWAPTTSGRAARDAAPSVDLSTVLLVHAVGSAQGVLTVSAAAERLGVVAATASRLCDRAVEGGYLEKRPTAGDGRRRALALTDEGRRLRRGSEDLRHEYLRRSLAGWPPEDVDSFTTLLSRFAKTVAEHPPTAPSKPRTTEGDPS